MSLTPPIHCLADRPALYLVPGFASREECLHAERRGGDWAFLEARGIEPKHDATGFSFELPIDGDPILEGLRARIEQLLGLHNELPETFRFRRYCPGEGHPPHLDCYDADGLLLVATALLYLNDPLEGGETDFPRAQPAPVQLPPSRGALALWFNYEPSGAPARESVHRARDVLEGTKATLAYFVYAAPEACGHRLPAGLGAS